MPHLAREAEVDELELGLPYEEGAEEDAHLPYEEGASPEAITQATLPNMAAGLLALVLEREPRGRSEFHLRMIDG